MGARAKTGGRLAVEIGGTFTDIIHLEGDGVMRALKVPSTPSSPDQGVMQGVEQLHAALHALQEVLHGSTVGTNAVLERKGAATALLVTSGFKDILEIQRGDKRNIYDIRYRRTPPLVSRDWVLPVPERLDARGDVLRPLDEEAVAAAAQRIRAGGIEAVAICFLHSYQNDAHERRAKEIVTRLAPGVVVVTSSELLPQFREYERASTTAMGAYVAPVMSSYVGRLATSLEAGGFTGNMLVTQSNGGVLPAAAIEREAVRTLLSGPAAGVTGAVHAAAGFGFRDLITLDMGGTSTDVCLVKGGMPLVTTDNKIDDLPAAVPMIDINTVGAGGGSIAHLDAHGMLHVGPKSAGADPGPACYGRGGTRPTVTDANVVRGVIRGTAFAGGALTLDPAAAERALQGLGGSLGLSAAAAADAVTRIVEANMMQAIRVISTQRGHDPRDYVLVAFGGAGPIHALGIAREMGIRRVLVPAHAGVLSAYGLLVADIERDYVQTRIAPCSALAASDVAAEFGRLAAAAAAEFRSYGLGGARPDLLPSCDVRYLGQAHELNIGPDSVAVGGPEVAAAFHDAHLRRYGFAFPGEEVELVNYRLKAVLKRGGAQLEAGAAGTAAPQAEIAQAVIGGTPGPCRFYALRCLPEGFATDGPAVIEDASTTCLVLPGWRAEVRGGAILIADQETP